MIRILIAEDSAVQRQLLAYLLEESGSFEVIGTARDGVEAAAMTEALRPDIVLMDCHMPRADGIESTRTIMQRCPTPIVMTSATSTATDTQFIFEAIRSGALAVVAKPLNFDSPEGQRQVAETLRILRLMSDVKVVGRRSGRMGGDIPPPDPLAGCEAGSIRVVAIAGSTGAPGVIADILTAIGPGLPASILIVQHISKGFVSGFANWLGQKSGLTVTMAAQGALLVPGAAYVAPDDAQMGIDAGQRIRLAEDAPEEDGFRPSANYLFRSVAQSAGRHAIGVLLTGMGRDGATGLLRLREAGGLTAVQDEASCAVFGMPAEAIALGAAEQVLPPAEIARFILAATKGLAAAPAAAFRP